MPVDTREQLDAWIVDSLRFRRRLRLVSIVAMAVALGVYLWSSLWGIVSIIIVGSVWGTGWWITYAHIEDWNQRKELLAQRERQAKRAAAAAAAPAAGRATS